MQKSVTPTPDGENSGILDLLGHLPPSAIPAGLNKEAAIELGEIVSQIAEAAAVATMAESAIVAACRTAGMDAVMLEACRRRGMRKGRTAFATAMRDHLALNPLVPPES